MTLPHHDDALLEGVDETSAQVFRAFIRTLRLHSRLMVRMLGERDMHPGQAFCLRFLAERDGLTQRDVAAGLHLAPPTVSKMLRGMEQAGLVDRRPDDADQRVSRVYLTPPGRELERRLRDVAAAYVNDTIGRLPEADRRELHRLLDQLSERIKTALEARPDGASDATEGMTDPGDSPSGAVPQP